MKTSLTQKRGFTLVEAMVAISILSLAVTGPLVIASKGLDSAIYAKDQITAFYLAQEAIEYVRNVRDTNRITGAAWLNGLDACLPDASGNLQPCEIDARKTDFTSPGAIQVCPVGTCDPLTFDADNTSSWYGMYGYGIGNPTKFTRTITIDNRAGASKQAAVSVTIAWNTNLFSPPRTFTVQEYLFNF